MAFMQPGQFGVNFDPATLGGGASSGIASMEMLGNYRGNMSMQNLLNSLVAQSNQAQFDTYQRDAPVREAERGEKIATAQTRKTTEPMRQLGAAQEQAAKGRTAMEGQSAESAANIRANQAKVEKEDFAANERSLEQFNMVLPMLEQSPTGMKDWLSFADKAGWKTDHPYRRYMETAGPSNFGSRLREIQSHATQNLTQRRALQQQQWKDDEAMGRTLVHEGAANWRAQLAAETQREAAQHRAAARQQADNLEKDLVKAKRAYLSAIAQKPMDPQAVAAAKAEYDLTFQQYVHAKSATAPQYYQIPGSGLEMGRPQIPTPQLPNQGAAPSTPGLAPGERVVTHTDGKKYIVNDQTKAVRPAP